MKRITITISAALTLLAFAPAALARHHHHRRHHSRAHHARIERFGRDVTTASPSTSSADNAGTVQLFSNGRLTILTGDGPVTGRVTRDTEIECTSPEQSQSIHEDGDRSGDDPSGDGDNSGSGDDQTQSSGDQSSGEDQGDAAEQNEDQAEDQNEDQAEDQNENEMEMENCSSSNLTQGTVVHEAVLSLSSAGTVWKKLELGS